jgi:hypothetical protein
MPRAVVSQVACISRDIIVLATRSRKYLNKRWYLFIDFYRLAHLKSPIAEIFSYNASDCDLLRRRPQASKPEAGVGHLRRCLHGSICQMSKLMSKCKYFQQCDRPAIKGFYFNLPAHGLRLAEALIYYQSFIQMDDARKAPTDILVKNATSG